jgi:site-specific recombinase
LGRLHRAGIHAGNDAEAALLWAALGIAATFVLNLGVSFYLALRLALRAQDISPEDHLAI